MLCTTCSVNNDITNSAGVMKRSAYILAQFELRDINNCLFTDVFEIMCACVCGGERLTSTQAGEVRQPQTSLGRQPSCGDACNPHNV